MGTTNILDLNNRLEKVEKENVAQNSYTSLKNKPKINNVTLTGNKTLADIGAAAEVDLTTLAGDVGDKTQLTTTVKTSTVAAINEVNGKLADGNIIDQLPNTTLSSIGTGKIAMYHDSTMYRCWVPFPFMTKNSNYTITLIGVSQDNAGDVLASTSVTAKGLTGFEVSIAGTYDYKKCGASFNYSITFA